MKRAISGSAMPNRIRAAQAAADAAKAAAPGDQGRQIKAVTRGTTTAVVNDSSFWHLIEFGSVNNPPYSPLRRGVDSVLDYKPVPR